MTFYHKKWKAKKFKFYHPKWINRANVKKTFLKKKKLIQSEYRSLKREKNPTRLNYDFYRKFAEIDYKT